MSEKLENNNEIIGIYFNQDYKRFKKGTFVSLNTKYFFDKDKKEILKINDYDLKYLNLIKKGYELNNFDIKGIVGNNGSGKTTILKILEYFFSVSIDQKKEIDNDLYFLKDYSIYYLNDIYYPSDIFLVVNGNIKTNNKGNFKLNKDYYLYNLNNIKNTNYCKYISNENNSNFIKKNIFLNTLKLTDDIDNIKDVIEIRTHTSSYENKSKESKEKILGVINDLTDYIINDFESTSENQEKYNYVIFEYIKKIFNNLELKEKVFNNKKESDNEILYKLYILYLWYFYLSRISNGSEKLYGKFNSIFQKKGKKILNKIISYTNYLELEFSDEFEKINTVLRKLIDIKNGNYLSEIQKVFSKTDYDYKLAINVFHFISEKTDFLIKQRDYYEYFEVDYDKFINDDLVSTLIYKNLNIHTYSSSDNTNEENKKIKEFISEGFLTKYDIKIKQGKYIFGIDGLSDGERRLMELFQTINFIKEDSKNKDIILLLDEPEEKLHLERQRKFLDTLLSGINQIFSKHKGKIIIFIATHSPFIISDLGQEHILFLERDKQETLDDNRKIETYSQYTTVKNFKEIVKKYEIGLSNTFLGNIPELIRGGFFLENHSGYLSEELVKKSLDNDFRRNIKINDLKEIAGDQLLFDYLVFENLTNNSK